MKPTKLFLFLAVAVLLGACTSKKQQPEDVDLKVRVLI